MPFHKEIDPDQLWKHEKIEASLQAFLRKYPDGKLPQTVEDHPQAEENPDKKD
jgi:hypothetical protein